MGIEKHFEALDRYLEEAAAGMTDVQLSAEAEVPLRAVVMWRKARGIKRYTGYRLSGEETRAALQGLAEGYEPALHVVEPFRGAWEPPEYVLRQALQYGDFCRAVYGLVKELGFSGERASAALGVRDVDIHNAILIWQRHLRSVGTSCAGCDVTIDGPGPYCCRRCREVSEV